MRETKLYWYPDTAYLIVPYFICLHFPNLVELLYFFKPEDNLDVDIKESMSSYGTFGLSTICEP